MPRSRRRHIHHQRPARPGTRSRGERGLTLALCSVAIVAMFALAAVVVDVGYAKQTRRQAQGSVDSAALAAAQIVGSGGTYAEAANVAKRIATENIDGLDDGDWSSCADPTPAQDADGTRPERYSVRPGTTGITGSCVTFDDPNRLVRVVLPEIGTPSFFGGVLGESRYQVDASAEAQYGVDASGFGVCGVCGIEGAEFQQGNNNSSIQIGDGREIQSDKVRINTNNKANDPDTIGFYDPHDSGANNASNNHKYTYVSLDQPVPNPFESVVVDYSTTVPIHPVMNATCTNLEPWYMYAQTANISNCTLTESGIYYFKAGIQVNGHLKAAAGTKITFVFGCASGTQPTDRAVKCNGGHTGNVNVSGSGSIQLEEPYLGGVSLMWDETANGQSVANWNGNVKVGGAFYAKAAGPNFAGNGVFETTGIVFGGATGIFNGGNIKISTPEGDGSGDGAGESRLWR